MMLLIVEFALHDGVEGLPPRAIISLTNDRSAKSSRWLTVNMHNNA